LDRYLLKNIIIIILVLVNGFLLGSLAMRYTAENRSRLQTEEQLVSLFAADSITLSQDAISREATPSPLSFTRDTEREREAVAFFLGKALLLEDQGGGISTYRGDAGVATFHSNGSFTIKGTLASENPDTTCEKFCSALSYGEPVFIQSSQDATTGTAAYLHHKFPVFNCTVSFTVENGVLTAVSGTLLPLEGSPRSENRELLTAPAALIAFQKMRRESGAACSAVTEMYPCYELQSTGSSALSLIPSWCVVTDVTNYYVNCVTGAVTSG